LKVIVVAWIKFRRARSESLQNDGAIESESKEASDPDADILASF